MLAPLLRSHAPHPHTTPTPSQCFISPTTKLHITESSSQQLSSRDPSNNTVKIQLALRSLLNRSVRLLTSSHEHQPPFLPLTLALTLTLAELLQMPPRSSNLQSSFSVSDANNVVVCPLKNHDNSSCRKRCFGVSLLYPSSSDTIATSYHTCRSW